MVLVVSSSGFRCASGFSIFFLLFSLFYLFINNEERGERIKKRKKITIEAH
jgi:hypothetical protein